MCEPVYFRYAHNNLIRERFGVVAMTTRGQDVLGPLYQQLPNIKHSSRELIVGKNNLVHREKQTGALANLSRN